MPMAPQPTVTVLMPVYNGERYVEEAIASVLDQDFHNFELIILDDASTDSSSQILQRWMARDSRIVVVHATENVGIACTLNRGLALARGKYVALLDHDDVCVRGRFGAQIAVLENESDVVLVSTGYDIIDSCGRWIGRMMPPPAPEVIAYLLNFTNVTSGVMFRREFVLNLGGYRAEFELAQDYDLSARLSQRGRIASLPIMGMKLRVHDERASVLWSERQRLHALKISHRMMTDFLARAIKPEEHDSVCSIIRNIGRPGVASIAHAVLREAFCRFAKANATRAHRRYVRFVMANHWVAAAAMLVRHGHGIEATRYLAYSLLWHPLGTVAAATKMMIRRAMWLFRTMRP